MDIARTSRHTEKVLSTYHLCVVGGLSASEAARRLDVHKATTQRWVREMRDALAQAKDVGTSRSQLRPSTLTPDDVARKRAELLAEAEASSSDQAMRLRQAILDSEQRRLGMEVQRIEQQTLSVQLQLMAPEERRAELAARIARLRERGMLPAGAPEGALQGAPEEGDPGASPPAGASPLSQGPPFKSPPKSEKGE